MVRLLPSLFGAALTMLAGGAHGAEQESSATTDERARGDPKIGHHIQEAVVFGNRLWLRGGDALVSLKLAGGDRRVDQDKGVVDVELAGGSLWMLVDPAHGEFERDPDHPTITHTLTIKRQIGDAFANVATLALDKGDAPIAFLVHRNKAIVIGTSSVRIYDTELRRWRTRRFSLPPTVKMMAMATNFSAAMTRDGSALYLGHNRGEWGGGLLRIELSTGATKDGCDEAGRFACGPVTAIIPDPDNDHCVVVSFGISHLSSTSGAVKRLCGITSTTILEKPNEHAIGDSTLPIFGLSRDASGYWAITRGKLFRHSGGAWIEVDLPKPTFSDGFWMSREIAGAILIGTKTNASFSTSGMTPLVVAIDPPSQ